MAATPYAAGNQGHDDPGRISVRKRLRQVLLALIALLYIVSVPWYRETPSLLKIQFGLPDWVAVALGCYLAIAVLNAIAWMLTEIPEGWDGPKGTKESEGRKQVPGIAGVGDIAAIQEFSDGDSVNSADSVNPAQPITSLGKP